MDDSPEILSELSLYWQTPLARPFIHPLGITIPKKRRVEDVVYECSARIGFDQLFLSLAVATVAVRSIVECFH